MSYVDIASNMASNNKDLKQYFLNNHYNKDVVFHSEKCTEEEIDRFFNYMEGFTQCLSINHDGDITTTYLVNYEGETRNLSEETINNIVSAIKR